MKTAVTVNNTTKAAIDENLVKKAVKAVIAGEGDIVGPAAGAEVSIALISPARIRQLNKMYRKHDTVTDVLSFGEEDDCGCDCGCSDGVVFLGELAICLQQVKKDAKEARVSLEWELAWVVVHGVLHLFGYDHETGPDQAREMREKEEFYLSKLKSVTS